ncbi:hypothetical protein VNO77_19408 [Canavalia gladiata]|uniref:Uncharacterized protein n=1 Tax=Canavalia gladiata TaxID=3824 RepID=A0AAN9QKG6_CANGL
MALPRSVGLSMSSVTLETKVLFGSWDNPGKDRIKRLGIGQPLQDSVKSELCHCSGEIEQQRLWRPEFSLDLGNRCLISAFCCAKWLRTGYDFGAHGHLGTSRSMAFYLEPPNVLYSLRHFLVEPTQSMGDKALLSSTMSCIVGTGSSGIRDSLK